MPLPPLSPGLVFVTVGTDHHRFDRLIDWVDAWAAHNPERPLLVQHGHSRPSSYGLNRPMLTIDEMQVAFARAALVVCGGGPGTVMDARAAGRLPVVVARRADRREVIDDHQRAFCQRLAALGKALVADDAATLASWLDAAVTDPGRYRVRVADEETPPGLRAIPQLIDGLLGLDTSIRSGRSPGTLPTTHPER
ncbi:MAG: glycosyltransferase [Acidimicrobiales bacterium]